MKIPLILSATAVLLSACGKTDAGARDMAGKTDTDTIAATTDTEAEAGVQLELLAVEFYNTAVFREPTEEYLTSRCTLPFVDKLRRYYERGVALQKTYRIGHVKYVRYVKKRNLLGCSHNVEFVGGIG